MSKPIGIPTTYQGIRFRSRTEARLAAFFDELTWPWEYEPLDLNMYIPDFLLHFDAPVLVEAKCLPGRSPDVSEAKDKIQASGWIGDALIVARAPGQLTPVSWCIGDLLRVDGPDGEVVSGKAELGRCLSCNSPFFFCGDQSFACRVCGIDCDGLGHVGNFDPTEAWARASNRVQWRAA
jgi:hypothetical protein